MQLPIKITDEILIEQSSVQNARDLEQLQRIVFPSLVEDEILHEEQYLKHMEIYPEGQLAALHQNKIIGASTSMQCDLDPENFSQHTFSEISANGWLSNHNPEGEWIYGIDISVHPDYRRKGIAKTFYEIRNAVAKKSGCKGQAIVGMLNGFAVFQKQMNIDRYFELVRDLEIFDPTVSVQEKIGFEIVSLVKNYLHDSTCGHAGVLMIKPVY